MIEPIQSQRECKDHPTFWSEVGLLGLQNILKTLHQTKLPFDYGWNICAQMHFAYEACYIVFLAERTNPYQWRLRVLTSLNPWCCVRGGKQREGDHSTHSTSLSNARKNQCFNRHQSICLWYISYFHLLGGVRFLLTKIIKIIFFCFLSRNYEKRERKHLNCLWSIFWGWLDWVERAFFYGDSRSSCEWTAKSSIKKWLILSNQNISQLDE